MANAAAPLSFKRLVVACDGTWMNSDNGFVRNTYLPWDTNGHLQTPSNVTRICRAIRADGDDDIPQVIYYQAGVGTEQTWWDHVYGGGTGAGLSENIREAYSFLAMNYTPGDEIFLIGFSRGAFTARSIAGLISCVGLLTTTGMACFYQVFNDWENQATPNFKTKFPDRPFHNRPNVNSSTYRDELLKRGLSRLDIPIRAVAVWDTVGALGIPQIGILPQKPSEYAFVDTHVSPNVEYAFHALALDEHRKPFSPTIWERPEGQTLPRLLKQCWFPGVHSNIGGSYDDTGIADITLAWMISQLSPLLSFDLGYLDQQHELSMQYYRQNHEAPRPWGMGKLYDSGTGITALAGKKVRTPGRYFGTDTGTGKTTGRKLRDTQEHVHACVRIRKDLGGLGTEDKGRYNPTALSGWRLAGSGQQHDVRWEYGGKEGAPAVVLPEDRLGEIELRLLSFSEREYKAATRGELSLR
ncbi:hypothetical protein MMC07_007656 [Pseudocyphellaria aurata]|nr:hypothetical protein [Pseudocyphellaria aurata]